MSTREHVAAAPVRRDAYALVSLAAGIIAAAGMVGFGTPVLAVFAVGAGHVALTRTRARQGRGRAPALIGLVLGYGVGVWGLALLLGTYLPAALSQA